MAKLIWSQRAQDDFIAITDYIASENPKAAERTGEHILAAARQLVDFPKQGRPGRADETREKIVKNTPYLLLYRLEGDALHLLRILHTARLWPPKEEV